MNDKLIWHWSSDGTVLYVKRIRQTRLTKRWILEPVTHFYTSDFTDVQGIAEDFIDRYNAKQQSKESQI